ncbi:hypothetical protein Tco_0357513 [Tanacetum coccineum]
MNFLSKSLIARITKQVKDQLPQILLEVVSNFAPLGNVYSLKRSRNNKDKDEDPSAGSDRGLKKMKTRKDAEPTKEEPEFEVADSNMPQDQEENLGNDDVEPKEKTHKQGQSQSWLMTLASSTKKPSKTFDELMSTLIDFFAFITNGLKINNLTQETLLGPAFKLLKEGGDYPFDLTKPLPLVMSGNHQKLPVDYFFNNDLKYLQGGASIMTYTTSIKKTKAAQYDLPGIEDMVPVKVAYNKHAV